MALILTLLTLIVLVAVLLFTVKSRIDLVLDSNSSDVHATLFWLYPLVKSVVQKTDNRFVLTVYLFNKRLLIREFDRSEKSSGSAAIGRLNPTDIHVETSYGFRDPFVTGLAVSAVTLACKFFKVESLYQRPDFLAANDYFNLNATARLNLGQSLLKLI